MAKKDSRGLSRFTLAVILYAVIVLLLAGFGLAWFWSYVELIELSQPEHAIENYMAQLSNEKLYAGAAQQISQLDSNLITQEQCHAIIDQTVAGGITYAKNNKESNSERYVYMLLSGGNTIGKVITQPGEPGKYGLRNWAATEDSFDFSFLMGDDTTITVPETFTVCANGTILDESYITETGIPYDILQDFYTEFEDLPCMVTYQAPAVWGATTLTVTDTNGNIVNDGQNTGWEYFPTSISPEQLDKLQAFIAKYFEQYVTFISCSNASRNSQFNRLAQYIVSDSPLVRRLLNAMEGLIWVSNQNAKLVGLEIDNCAEVDDARYLLELTYTTTRTFQYKTVTEETIAKVLLIESGDQFLVESMMLY